MVCGSARTEEQYLKGLRASVANLAVDLTVVKRPKDPYDVVGYAIDHAAQRQRSDFDEVWCVFDVDDFDVLPAVKYEEPLDRCLASSQENNGVTVTDIVRPYGDTTGDGMVQTSFTLPVPHDKRAEGAALQLAAKMGLDPAMLVHARQIGTGHTFFVVYGSVQHLVELDQVRVAERDFPLLGAKEVNALVRQRLRRKLVVVGACIGTDAHTVGIDAICNLKGIAGEKGLEYYRELAVTNMGAQVSVPDLVERARAERADAVLVSQVVTQRDAHLHNTREMSAAFREAFPAERRPLLVVGGPRFDEMMAGELGVDRIFSRGTTPREVASYLVHALVVNPPQRRVA